MIAEFTSSEIQDLVAKLILVWNNLDYNVPQEIMNLEGETLTFLKMKWNSLNIGWAETLNFVDTDSVINLAQDLCITREALKCMMAWFKLRPGRLITPYVRNVNSTRYASKNVFHSEPYAMSLARVLMLPTPAQYHYAKRAYEGLHKYVDNQELLCDDVLLNVIAQES